MEDLLPRLLFGIGGAVSRLVGLAYLLMPRRLSGLAVRLAGGGYRLGPGFETLYTVFSGIIMTVLGVTLLYVTFTE